MVAVDAEVQIRRVAGINAAAKSFPYFLKHATIRSCGRCERSAPPVRLNAEARAIFGDVTLEQVLDDARRSLLDESEARENLDAAQWRVTQEFMRGLYGTSPQ